MSLASLPTPQENFETTDVCQQVHRRVLVKFLTSKFGFSNDEASRLTNDEIYKIMGDKYESFPKDEIKEICIDEIYNLPNAEFYDFFKAYSPKLLFPVLRNLCEFVFNSGKDKEVTTVLQLLAPQPTHQPTHRFFSKAVPFTGNIFKNLFLYIVLFYVLDIIHIKKVIMIFYISFVNLFLLIGQTISNNLETCFYMSVLCYFSSLRFFRFRFNLCFWCTMLKTTHEQGMVSLLSH
jgi:hypothetical protein